jgi:hypothetical protein
LRALWSLSAFALLAACVTVPRQLPTREWMIGAWLAVEGKDRDVFACNSGLPISYSADGRYTMWEESGDWSLQGDRLTEMATEAHEHVDPAEVAVGRRFVSRIDRIGDNEMRKTLATGGRMTLLRCPDAQ